MRDVKRSINNIKAQQKHTRDSLSMLTVAVNRMQNLTYAVNRIIQERNAEQEYCPPWSMFAIIGIARVVDLLISLFRLQ